MHKVIGTETYAREIEKWPKKDRETAEKISKQLSDNPLAGKPLNYPFLREKRVGGRRIYYLVYSDLSLVLVVATSDKKNQQSTIEHIKGNLDEFRKVAEEIIKQVS